MNKFLKGFFTGCSQIFLTDCAATGVIIITLCLLTPRLGLGGLIAVSASWGFSRLVGIDKKVSLTNYYIFNPLLVGYGLSFKYTLNLTTVCLIAAAGIFTFCLTIFLNQYLAPKHLPVLSLPFALVIGIISLYTHYYQLPLTNNQTPLTLIPSDPSLPLLISGYFRAFSEILFCSSVLIGILTSGFLFWKSPIIFMLTVIGYLSGTATLTIIYGSLPTALTNGSLYNCILISMALGAIFLVPSSRSYILAAILSCLGALLTYILSLQLMPFQVPVLTLPFNIIVIAAILLLRHTSFPLLSYYIGKTAEQTLEIFHTSRFRFKDVYQRNITLPFSGTWTVWQGIDDKWTHKGPWKYAFDFIITDEFGNSHSGKGTKLEDYYAFKKPVLSPIEGVVVRVISSLKDKLPGCPDTNDNWGNLVIIRHKKGFFIEISHFAQNTIKVQPGEQVRRGTIIGFCGNSGFSPQPHIHIQVQLLDEPGETTIPFCFVNYIQDRQYRFSGIPKRDSKLTSIFSNKNNKLIAQFTLDQSFEYQVFKDDKVIDHFTINICMAADGSYYLLSGQSKLYFGIDDYSLTFYRKEGKSPWLSFFFIALSRIPLVPLKQVYWKDYIPVSIITTGFKHSLLCLLGSFFPDLLRIKASSCFENSQTIITTLSSRLPGINSKTVATLDNNGLISSIRYNNYEIRLLPIGNQTY